jgi:hypothetical protein
MFRQAAASWDASSAEPATEGPSFSCTSDDDDDDEGVVEMAARY